eukprot:COSAG02_NODE_4793_length_4973_cov_2.768158_2_plen_241_part_00
MSCPELGTLNLDGGGPYDQNVMEKVQSLQHIGYLKFGFDRAGTSSVRERDRARFGHAFALYDEGKYDDANRMLKSTDWWYGYSMSVKQAIKLECQGFDGTLDIVCITGGPITQLERAEMDTILTEARSDCGKFGIEVKYVITEMQYGEFLAQYDLPMPIVQDVQELPQVLLMREDVPADGNVEAFCVEEVHAQLAEAQERLAAKDEQLSAKDEQLSAKDEELQQLRAQLARLEGVPPDAS